MMFTLLGGSSFARFCQQEFGEFLWLLGRYCSYLLPKQAGGTPHILVDKTLRMTSRLRVYNTMEFLRKIQGRHMIYFTVSLTINNLVYSLSRRVSSQIKDV